MTTTESSPFNYDEWLDQSATPWRRRATWVAIIAAALVIAVVAIWWQFLRGGSSATAAPQTATANIGSIQQTVSESGTVSAQQTSSMSFQQSGKVTAVNVALGQQVHQGDVLAQVDPTTTQQALQTAQSNLAVQQAKLKQVLQGSTASQLASADQSLTQAQTNYNNAVNALQTLQQPPADADVAAAQQAVQAAQGQLATAQQNQANLQTNNDAAVTAAQAAVTKAQQALTVAQSADSAAALNVSSAQASLDSAETNFCPDANVSFCGSPGALTASDQSYLLGLSTTGTPTQAAAAAKVLSSNTSYATALNGKQSADYGVTNAQNDLATAQTALTTAQAGPSAASVQAAQAAVNAAQLSLQSAQDKLNTVMAGPTQAQLATAQGAVDTAAAGLKAAKASRNQAYAGSLPADVQSAQQAVTQAQITVSQAQTNLDETKLIAPFDGTVAAINVHVGDTAGAGGGGSTSSSSSSSSAAIVLNTPNALTLNITVPETDLANVKVGQTGTATFQAIAGRTFPVMIDAIGTNPTTTQGVVTYQAQAHFLNGADAANFFRQNGGAGGLGAPGRLSGPGVPSASGTPGVDVGSAQGTPVAGRTPRAGRTPGAGFRNAPSSVQTAVAEGTPFAGRGGFGGGGNASGTPVSTASPAPGMNAQVTLIVAQAQDVITVPASAVQRSGGQSTVHVKQSDGTTKPVTVTTGLSNGQSIAITSGLNEGDVVVLPTVAASSASTTSGAANPAGTGRGGGFFFGGGGGGGGGRGGGG